MQTRNENYPNSGKRVVNLIQSAPSLRLACNGERHGPQAEDHRTHCQRYGCVQICTVPLAVIPHTTAGTWSGSSSWTSGRQALETRTVLKQPSTADDLTSENCSDRIAARAQDVLNQSRPSAVDASGPGKHGVTLFRIQWNVAGALKCRSSS